MKRIFSLTFMIVSLCSFALPANSQQQDLEDHLRIIEESCGETYNGIMGEDHSKFLCMQVFGQYCVRKEATDPRYRERYTEATDRQLAEGIENLDAQMEQTCRILGNAQTACPYC
ncbi:MAG: hypothetical protein F4142_02260 [Nitrospira sp. SB0675_bin_23]|nr:hypothetical protein [Nitrospira sp. SB0661_bin_20]MYH01413.1 hypothetical protein [Nitrospira sp. SB0675_bin_23]